MRKTHANPDNLPFGEFEEFDLVKDAVVAEPKRLYGKLKTIRAHTFSEKLSVEYLEMLDVEILSQKDEKSGEIRFAVSFRVHFRLLSRDGKILAPPGSEALTRVSYWNFGRQDFHMLNFLRSAADKMLFIAACTSAPHLFGMAKEYRGSEVAVEKTAYVRAIRLQEEMGTDAEAMAGFREYISLLLKGGAEFQVVDALTLYRRLDNRGEFGCGLARLLHSQGQKVAFVEEVLSEAVARLLKNKPREYSVQLGDILEFVCAENFSKPSAEQLLWQAYLAASGERELPVLKRIWTRAVKMKADRETLRLIYNTWRGFARPPRALAQDKAPPELSAPL
jgi:hypothetical protein